MREYFPFNGTDATIAGTHEPAPKDKTVGVFEELDRELDHPFEGHSPLADGQNTPLFSGFTRWPSRLTGTDNGSS